MATLMTIEEQHQVIELLAAGYTPNKIGLQLGRDRKTIAAFSRQPHVQEAVTASRMDLADAFESVAHRMIESIDDDEIKKVPPDKRVIAACAATDKLRLLRGQATQNIAVFCASAVIRAHASSEDDEPLPPVTLEVAEGSSG